MKYLIIPLFVLLVGCDAAPPMSEAEAKAYQSCLDKGWVPRFWTNSAQRDITCNPRQKQTIQ